MGQLLRGIAARKAASVSLFLLVLVVVAGTVTAVTFSELTGTPLGAVGALLLLGVVAVSVQSSQVAQLRHREIALAQIRGRARARLYAYYLTEPFTVLVAATVGGVFVGREVTQTAADAWLGPEGTVTISHVGVAAVCLAAALCLVAVAAGSYQTLQQPLVEQLDEGRRPRRSATLVLLGQTVVLVAAAIAVYQAAHGGGVREDWRGLASPALLTPVLTGLAAAQIAAWLLAFGSARAVRLTGRSRGGGLGAFLTVRRLARRRDTVGGTSLVVAAAVVAAVTVSSAGAVAAWQDETARLRLGGPQRMEVSGGALAAYTLSRQADPDGRWLMAVVTAPDRSEAYRRTFADMERWDSVVGDFFAGTGAAAVSQSATVLRAADVVRPMTVDQASVVFDRGSLQDKYHVQVTISYVDDDGDVDVAVLTPTARPGAGTDRVTTPVDSCSRGCVVHQITVNAERNAGRTNLLELSGLRFGTTDLLAGRGWRPVPGDYIPDVLTYAGDLMRVQVSPFSEPLLLSDLGRAQPLPALSTPGVSLFKPQRHRVTFATDGSQHPVDVVATVPALPFVGRQGLLLDLPSALAGASSMISTATAAIVARADTPASVLATLETSGQVSAPQRYPSTLERARARPDAQGIRLYVLMSLFASLIAAISLVGSVLAQRAERRDEAASLRVCGVPVSSINNASAVEAAVLAVTAFVVVGLAGWAASGASLDALSLVPRSEYLPVMGGPTNLAGVVAVAAGAALLVGIVTYAGCRGVARTSPPSRLRGGGSR